MQWLLFLAQLPAAPSSARVAVWRRLRSAGAAAVLNGAWVLPKTAKHLSLLTELAQFCREQGGQATVLKAGNLSPAERDEIQARFVADRGREYREFALRADTFLAEIAKESALQKFSFAELEELESDLGKMKAWLGKIRGRDFFRGDQSERAGMKYAECEESLRAFAARVYRAEGLDDAPPDSSPR